MCGGLYKVDTRKSTLTSLEYSWFFVDIDVIVRYAVFDCIVRMLKLVLVYQDCIGRIVEY